MEDHNIETYDAFENTEITLSEIFVEQLVDRHDCHKIVFFFEKFSDQHEEYSQFVTGFHNYLEQITISNGHKILLAILFLNSRKMRIRKFGKEFLASCLKESNSHEEDFALVTLEKFDRLNQSELLSSAAFYANVSIHERFTRKALNIAKFSVTDANKNKLAKCISIKEIYCSRAKEIENNHYVVDALMKHGHEITHSLKNCQENLMEMFNHISPMTVCEAFVDLSSDLKFDCGWRSDIFIEAVKRICPEFDYVSLVHCFDLITWKKPSMECIARIVKIYTSAFGVEFPVKIFYHCWNNYDVLLLFIEYSIKNTQQLSFVVHPFIPVRLLIPRDTRDPGIISNWSSFDFILLLLKVYPHRPLRVRDIVKNGITKYPDYILFGIFQQENFFLDIPSKIFLSEVISYYLENEKHGSEYLKFIWSHRDSESAIQELMIQVMQEYFASSFLDVENRVARILNVAQNLNAIAIILKNSVVGFAIELAILASKRNFVSLPIWMSEQVIQHKDIFLSSLIGYIRHHYHLLSVSSSTVPSSEEISDIQSNWSLIDQLISFIMEHCNLLCESEQKAARMIYSKYKLILENSSHTRTTSSDRNKLETASQEINSLFNYCGSAQSFEDKMSCIEEFIKNLYSDNSSPEAKSLLINTFDLILDPSHYSYYNDFNLHTVGFLIGRLAQLQLIDENRVILLIDRLLNTNIAGSSFFFMASVLLYSYPQIGKCNRGLVTSWCESHYFLSLPAIVRIYCYAVSINFHTPYLDPLFCSVEENCRSLIRSPSYINIMTQKIDPSNFEFIRPKSELTMYFQRFDPESNLNIPKKKTYDYFTPDADSSRRITRLINSMTSENVQETATEIRGEMKPENVPWLAKNIVREHISLHNNLHQPFLRFISVVDDYQFAECVRFETNEYIIELFSRPTLKSNRFERDLIKNLGSWFGLMTLAQNKPVIHNEIDIKILLIEGMHKGQEDLCIIVPFVKNFLMTSVKSLIFTQSNPFIIAIMSVLAELCLKTDLRSNLQIEIESLFRHLKINIRSINPSKYTTVLDWMTNPQKYLHWTEIELNCVLNKFNIDPEKYLLYSSVDVTALSNILQYICLDNCPEEHKPAVGEAFSSIVRELGIWILDRVCKAVSSLVEVVVKQDFRLDSDESHLLFASHVFSKSVALSYAGVLLKGTYFSEISKRIRLGIENAFRKSVLQQKNQIEKEKIDMIVYTICQDNIETLFCFISKSCAEKIVSAVDKRLSTVETTSQQRDSQGDLRQIVCLDQLHQNDFLPDKLKTKPGTPTQSQMSVYHEFNKFIPGFSSKDKTQYLENQILFSDSTDKFPTLELNEYQCQILFSSLRTSLRNLYFCISSFVELNPLYDQLIHLIHVSMTSLLCQDVRFLSGFINKLIQLYFGSLLVLHDAVETRGFLLPDLIFAVFIAMKHTKLIDNWLVSVITNSILDMSNDIKYNVQIIMTFLHYKLISVCEIDSRIACEIANGKIPQSIEFAMNLCKKCLIDHQFYGMVTEFDLALVLDTLTQLTNNTEVDLAVDAPHSVNLVDRDEIILENGKSEAIPENLNGNSEYLPSIIVEQLLREWVKLYYTKGQTNPDTNFTAYLKIISQRNVLKNEESILRFLQTCFEIIVELSFKISENAVLLRVYQIIDSYSHLIIMMIKYFSSPCNAYLPCKMNLFNKILRFIGGMLHRDIFMRAEVFRSFVYERVLIGFAMEITRPDGALNQMRNSLFVCFAGFIHGVPEDVYSSFAYSLIVIVGHKCFINGMLTDKSAFKNRSLYRMLLCDMLHFISPYISEDIEPTPQSIEALIDGIIRIFLALLHDFPSFLAENYIYFVSCIPENCVQLRNIVLCASPDETTFPKPTISIDNISSLPLPQIIWTLKGNLPISLIKLVEIYLSSKSIDYEFDQILNFLKAPSDLSGLKYYNNYFIHFALFIFHNFLMLLKPLNKKINMDSVRCSPHMMLISNLVREFDKQGKFYFISAMANHIRYSNVCTKYFILVILQLFFVSDETTRDIITRVLVERVVCAPPHSWGILNIINTLMKNHEYRFFQNQFVYSNSVLLGVYEALAQKTQQSVNVPSSRA